MKEVLFRAGILLLVLTYAIYRFIKALIDGPHSSDFFLVSFFIIVVIIGLVRIYKGYKGAKFGIPVDDELSKKRLIHVSAKMLPFSMITMFFAMLLIEDKVLNFDMALTLALIIICSVFFGYIWYYKVKGIKDDE